MYITPVLYNLNVHTKNFVKELLFANFSHVPAKYLTVFLKRFIYTLAIYKIVYS